MENEVTKEVYEYSTLGPPRLKRWAKHKKGRIVKRKYIFLLSEVHGIYKSNFISIDVFNKVVLGPGSIQKAYKMKSWT